jgi:hypothetical protein
VTVTRHRLHDGAGRTIRIVQLTDLHLRTVGAHEERVAEAVHALRPELLVLTGDAIDRPGDLSLLERFLSLLPSAPHRLAILGNWEHWAGVDLDGLARVYARQGWQLLRNASVPLRFGVAELLVTGLDDLVGGAPDVRAALAGVAPRPHHLLLAHCPAHREALPAAARVGIPTSSAGSTASGDDIDPRLLTPQVMLAGHTHGGQVALFGWAPLRPPGSGRYVQGWYRDAATALYVSRGIGTSIVPARFCAAPEIAFFEWTLAAT